MCVSFINLLVLGLLPYFYVIILFKIFPSSRILLERFSEKHREVRGMKSGNIEKLCISKKVSWSLEASEHSFGCEGTCDIILSFANETGVFCRYCSIAALSVYALLFWILQLWTPLLLVFSPVLLLRIE